MCLVVLGGLGSASSEGRICTGTHTDTQTDGHTDRQKDRQTVVAVAVVKVPAWVLGVVAVAGSVVGLSCAPAPPPKLPRCSSKERGWLANHFRFVTRLGVASVCTLVCARVR